MSSRASKILSLIGLSYEGATTEELKEIFRGNESLASWAIRWILMFPQVSTVIPGASKIDQVHSNVKASNLPEISAKEMKAVKNIYDKYFKADIHHLW